MRYRTFAQANNLKSGDVVISPKTLLNIVDHYVVFLGVNELSQEIYIENDYRNGVQLISGEVFSYKNPRATGIRKLNGDDTQRYWAVERAKSLLTAKYDLERFNCENFANYVQYGVSFSKQVNVARKMVVAGAILTIATAFQRSFN